MKEAGQVDAQRYQQVRPGNLVVCPSRACFQSNSIELCRSSSRKSHSRRAFGCSKPSLRPRESEASRLRFRALPLSRAWSHDTNEQRTPRGGLFAYAASFRASASQQCDPRRRIAHVQDGADCRPLHLPKPWQLKSVWVHIEARPTAASSLPHHHEYCAVSSPPAHKTGARPAKASVRPHALGIG